MAAPQVFEDQTSFLCLRGWPLPRLTLAELWSYRPLFGAAGANSSSARSQDDLPTSQKYLNARNLA